ncbi:MAG: response regulator [Planctomycetota bacterium]|jgi:FixJ family two-component response regulator
MESRAEPVVFVVDDDDAIRESLAILLDAYGFHVEAYARPSEFLDAADTSSHACLILDARLPGMSGIELLDELAADGRDLPSLMVTGHGDVDLFSEALKRGVIKCFKKPFCGDELMATVEVALTRASGEAS